ncbi:glycerol-3-phosphate 1-O-acyltransferase PlsY [bacterium]|nr:MAG: glycerol-3-phosphate 1-O-acyltransferase PlsY [bacterium]
MVSLFIILIASYLLGSVSPSIILSRLLKGVDVRTTGSGNAGMTNAVRLLGGRWGAVVAFIDLAKGFCAAMFITSLFFSGINLAYFDETLVRILAGVAAVAGHIWTVFFGFKGGKGVLTVAGAVLGVAPLQVGICFLVFLIVFGLFRYISLGSIVGSWVFPIMVFIQKFILDSSVSFHLVWFSVFVAVLITFTHRENIVRLLRGEEKKFGKPATHQNT